MSGKIKCQNPACDQVCESDWDECPKCETPLLRELKCGCGAPLQRDWRKCPICKTPKGFVTRRGRHIEMVRIPGGEFLMGSDSSEAYSSEQPVHRVQVSSFEIGKYPVTQGQWKAVIGENPSHFDKGDDYPVENISWEECQEFIIKLNRMTGESYRLPTEAEWEYAARGGITADRYGEIDDIAWHDANSDSSTRPVGKKRANAYGLYDMLGNVWEWVQDWHGEYNSGYVSDPTGPASGVVRVCRGGSWGNYAGNCRASIRYRFTPDFRSYNLGMRLARG